MAKLKPYRGDYYLWEYVPNRVPAILFAILFSISTIAVSWRMFKTRTWFVSVFVIGGSFEVIGYIIRILAHDSTNSLVVYILQNTFIVLAPALFAASIYMVLGRIIRSIKGEAYSLIPIRWLTTTFVMGDVLSFTVQGSAAPLMAAQTNPRVAEGLIVGGLFIQIVIFTFFIATTAVFQLRMRRFPTPEAENPMGSWAKDIYMLYTVSMLILVRSVFRVIEFIMGKEGYLLSYEWPLYVFDALLMFAVTVIFFIRYPSQVVPQKGAGGRILLRDMS